MPWCMAFLVRGSKISFWRGIYLVDGLILFLSISLKTWISITFCMIKKLMKNNDWPLTLPSMQTVGVPNHPEEKMGIKVLSELDVLVRFKLCIGRFTRLSMIWKVSRCSAKVKRRPAFTSSQRETRDGTMASSLLRRSECSYYFPSGIWRLQRKGRTQKHVCSVTESRTHVILLTNSLWAKWEIARTQWF